MTTTTPLLPRDDAAITTANHSTQMKFARRFLRSLSKMSNARSSSICVKRRSERLKMAAYWCMARAVGSRRAWSRAILMKLSRRRRHHRHFSVRRMGSGKSRATWLKKKKNIYTAGSRSGDEEEEEVMKRQTEKLREVVPGGKLMDICSLLEETAHFVTCLAAQVHVMQTIAHHFS